MTIYGSFRDWGHPYLDHIAGLNRLHAQTTLEKNIDTDYANALASDLTKMVLQKVFKEKRVWAVHGNLVPGNRPLRNHITPKAWQTAQEVKNLGDVWHQLPDLAKCFDIPDVIDPTVLYSDKSHSMQISEVLNHITKLLYTHQEEANWPEFLDQLKYGLDWEDLVVGLKGKEIQLKIEGLFFALMAWKLREYFVITE